MRRTPIALGAVLVALALTACSGGQLPASSDTPGDSGATPSESLTPVPLPSGFPSPVPSGMPVAVPAAYWEAMVADLADRGITGEPELVSSVAVTWPDGSLGCPEPGMAYIQVLIDGMQVILSVDGVPFDYRFGSSPLPRLCEG